MKIAVSNPVSHSYHSLRTVVMLSLLFSFVVGACGTPAATEPPTVMATAPATVEVTPTMTGPIIDTGGPCTVNVGEKLPLVVSGISDAGFTYRWTATSGKVEPQEGPAVNYIPSEPGAVIIRVEAQKDGVSLPATINCTVTGPTATPETPTPVSSPTPLPTKWACTSYRSEKIGTAEVPGEVKIDPLLSGITDIPSKQDVQVNGSYTGIPEGMYLWVFLYSADAGLHGRYYPQTKDAVKGWQPDPTTGQDGLWTLKVNFGAPNLCYEIIVVMANAEASQSIAAQLKSWANVNNYAGYELNGPATADPPDAPGFPEGLVEKASIEVRTK